MRESAKRATERNHGSGVVIRPLEEADLSAADNIMRVAFGTFTGVPEPATFFGDASYVRNRWKAEPGAAYAAELDGEIVGSNFAARWGSFGFFGPLTTRPDVWDRGIGKKLMEPIMSLFSDWDIQLAGLFTFPHSPKHIGLYQKYGFRPRYLTAVMSKPVGPAASTLRSSRFSELSEDERVACLQSCYRITDSVFEGLDLSPEIRAIESLALGDTVLLWDESELVAFACCHEGPDTEAGSDACYVKFAAVRAQKQSARYFDELLTACASFAASKGASRLVAGVNTSRQEAYESMLQKGFRTDDLGIAMHKPNEPGFSQAGVYVLDDWR